MAHEMMFERPPQANTYNVHLAALVLLLASSQYQQVLLDLPLSEQAASCSADWERQGIEIRINSA